MNVSSLARVLRTLACGSAVALAIHACSSDSTGPDEHEVVNVDREEHSPVQIWFGTVTFPDDLDLSPVDLVVGSSPLTGRSATNIGDHAGTDARVAAALPGFVDPGLVSPFDPGRPVQDAEQLLQDAFDDAVAELQAQTAHALRGSTVTLGVDGPRSFEAHERTFDEVVDANTTRHVTVVAFDDVTFHEVELTVVRESVVAPVDLAGEILDSRDTAGQGGDPVGTIRFEQTAGSGAPRRGPARQGEPPTPRRNHELSVEAIEDGHEGVTDVQVTLESVLLAAFDPADGPPPFPGGLPLLAAFEAPSGWTVDSEHTELVEDEEVDASTGRRTVTLTQVVTFTIADLDATDPIEAGETVGGFTWQRNEFQGDAAWTVLEQSASVRGFTVPSGPPGSFTVTQLTPDDGAPGDRFGFRMAASGTTAVIGTFRGEAAYVFERVAGQWAQTAKLTGDEPNAARGFEVDIDGDVIVASQYASRKTYVFERVGGSWERTATFDGLESAIGGDRLLITEDREGPVGVYERVGGGWQRVSGFGPGSPHNGIFGDELALGGDYALIGASNGGYAQVPLPQPWGHAFIYELQNDAWVQVVHLLNPDGDSRGFSWRAAGIHGNRAVVGDFGDGLPEGTVHPYVRRADGTWEAEPILRRQGDNCFGFSADIDADLLVAGTCKSGSFAGALGSAYVYWRSGDAWVPLHTLEDPAANDTSEFGHVVAAGPDFVLVAAPGEFQSGHVGSVFVYDLVR